MIGIRDCVAMPACRPTTKLSPSGCFHYHLPSEAGRGLRRPCPDSWSSRLFNSPWGTNLITFFSRSLACVHMYPLVQRPGTICGSWLSSSTLRSAGMDLKSSDYLRGSSARILEAQERPCYWSVSQFDNAQCLDNDSISWCKICIFSSNRTEL